MIEVLDSDPVVIEDKETRGIMRRRTVFLTFYWSGFGGIAVIA